MGMLLQFMPYTAGESDSVQVWRTTADNLEGKELIRSLPAGTHTFNDRSVEPNKVYQYWLLNKSATYGDKWSQPITGATFLDTGPGPAKLFRGDWTFGYFGFVPVASMFTYAQVKTAAEIVANPDALTLTGFHKCAVGGRIIYIGDVIYSSLVNKVAVGKALLAQDSDVLTTAPRIQANNYEYIIRCPYSSTLHTTEIVNQGSGIDDSLKRSEVAMVVSLLLDAGSTGKLGDYKLSDMPGNGLSTFYFSNTYAVPNIVNVFSLINDATIGPASDMTANRPFWPVFELVVHE